MIRRLSRRIPRVLKRILRSGRYLSGVPWGARSGAAAAAEARVLTEPASGEPVSEAYWRRHNVTAHRVFNSVAESLAYFDWRNDQYPGYIDLMPVTGVDGKVVLDFGCGPGNDLAGFATFSKPTRLIGMDVSITSLAEAESRLRLHGVQAELVKIDPKSANSGASSERAEELA